MNKKVIILVTSIRHYFYKTRKSNTIKFSSVKGINSKQKFAKLHQLICLITINVMFGVCMCLRRHLRFLYLNSEINILSTDFSSTMCHVPSGRWQS